MLDHSQKKGHEWEVFEKRKLLRVITVLFYSINRPGRLSNFWTLRVGAYSRWALIRGWALIKFSPFSASEACLFYNKTINANNKTRSSLRADEIKLWLTPSAKQRRNPCSGLPAVYPDLSTRHDWPVKKGLCFVCRDRQSGWRGIRNALPVIRWVRWGSRTRISALLRRGY